MYKTIIIDDEPQAIMDLEGLIALYCPDLEVIGTATTTESAKDLIRKERPDILFLDIQIDDRSGLQLLAELEPLDAEVIFVTAHEQYAIDAMRLSAVDYLLKPVDIDLLIASVSRVIDKLKSIDLEGNLSALLNNLVLPATKHKRMVLSTLEMIHLVDVDDIVLLKSEANYTRFKLTDQPDILISRTLKEYVDQLTPYGFLRIHRSYLINVRHLTGYDKREGGSVVMAGGEKLPVATRKREEFMKVFEQWK